MIEKYRYRINRTSEQINSDYEKELDGLVNTDDEVDGCYGKTRFETVSKNLDFVVDENGVLLKYLGSQKGTIKIPDTVKRIEKLAFGSTSYVVDTPYFNTKLERLIIPKTVKYIESTAFQSTYENLTIYGEPGSAAQTFANQNNISFQNINNLNEEDIYE